jgi:WD40 repeat protein
MVTLHDGDAVPKVIDFGIAKATNQKLTEKTLFTNYSHMIGTPAYMSPEQAEMSGLDVDTRTDVYSLGVLLYELLTGRTPFCGKELMSGGYAEMQRIIAEQEPPKPSRVLSSMQDAECTTLATNRSIDIGALNKVFQGDLDWIVMKSLEKDRRRRYETPSEFAADLQRHLDDEPVMAAAPSLSYQLTKFVKKHRTLVIFAVILSVVLFLATIVSGSLAVNMNGLRKEAVDLRQTESDLRIAAQKESARAVKAETEAIQKSIILEDHLYVSDMLAAGHALSKQENLVAETLLDRHQGEQSGRDLRGFEWRYLRNQADKFHFESLNAHKQAIRKIKLLDGGKQLLTAGAENKVILWDTASKQKKQEWDAYPTFAVSMDERFLGLCSRDGVFAIWDLVEEKFSHRLSNFSGDSGMIQLSYDGKHVLTQFNDGGGLFESRHTWIGEVETGDEIQLPQGRWWHQFSPKGPMLVLAGAPGHYEGEFDGRQFPEKTSVFLWDYEINRQIDLKPEPKGSVTAFSPKGKFLSVADDNYGRDLLPATGIEIYQVSTGERVCTIPDAYAHRFSLFSPDEAFLISRSVENKANIKIWEVKTGKLITTLKGVDYGLVSTIFYSKENSRLLTGSNKGLIQEWDIQTGDVIREVAQIQTDLTGMELDADENRLMISDKYGDVKFLELDAKPSKLSDEIPQAMAIVCNIVSPDGNYLFSGEKASKDVRLVGVDPSYDTTKTNKGTIDGARQLEASDRPRLWKETLFNTHNGEALWSVDFAERALGFAKNKNTVLTLSKDSIHVRALENGNLVEEIELEEPIHSYNLFSYGHSRFFAFHTERQMVAVHENLQLVRLFDASSGRTIRALEEPLFATNLRFSPNGELILFSGRSQSGFWDYGKDRLVWVNKKEDDHNVYAMDASPDGKIIAGACSDDTLRIWDVESGHLIRSFRGIRDLLRDIYFTPDGRSLALVRRKPVLALWSTSTWQQVASFQWPGTTIEDAGFSPDGSFLMTSSYGEGVRFWRAPLFKKFQENPTIHNNRLGESASP